MSHHGNEDLPDCAPLLDPPLPNGLWGQITPKSGIFFEHFLVKNYRADWSETNVEASVACPDVMYARYGHWLLEIGAQRASPYFGNGH